MTTVCPFFGNFRRPDGHLGVFLSGNSEALGPILANFYPDLGEAYVGIAGGPVELRFCS